MLRELPPHPRPRARAARVGRGRSGGGLAVDDEEEDEAAARPAEAWDGSGARVSPQLVTWTMALLASGKRFVAAATFGSSVYPYVDAATSLSSVCRCL